MDVDIFVFHHSRVNSVVGLCQTPTSGAALLSSSENITNMGRPARKVQFPLCRGGDRSSHGSTFVPFYCIIGHSARFPPILRSVSFRGGRNSIVTEYTEVSTMNGRPLLSCRLEVCSFFLGVHYQHRILKYEDSTNELGRPATQSRFLDLCRVGDGASQSSTFCGV